MTVDVSSPPSSSDPDRPRLIDRLARAFAVFFVAHTFVLLFIGSLVTTFRAGMDDPIWPTEPWFLAVSDKVEWKESQAGFLVEHTHRAVAASVGLTSFLVCLFLWLGERVRWIRWLGIISLIATLATFIWLYIAMMTASKIRESGGGLTWPREIALICSACAGVLLLVSSASISWGRGMRAARLLASFVLICVMIQGLLGGLRVYLDQLVGTELRQIHGAFAQMVFAMTAGIMTLSARSRPGDALPDQERGRLIGLSILLVLVLTAQLIFGAIVRHTGTPVSQRLHILTAFLVTGCAVWLSIRTLTAPESRKRLSFAARHLLIILGVQVLLGVETWMRKFAASAPQAGLDAMARKPETIGDAATLTLHVLIGASLLASAVSYLIRIARRPAVDDESARPSTLA